MTDTLPKPKPKFDMGIAWEEGAGLLRGNSTVISGIAGVFFFIPIVALLLVVPDLSSNPAFASETPDPEAMTKVIEALFAEIWWMILIVALAQGIGMMTLYRLLTDKNRPTVGEALKFGAIALLPYIGATLLTEVVRLIVVGLPSLLFSALGLGALGALVGLVVTIYLYVKFSLVPPVVGIERQFNPIKALLQSWKLTKGNSLRLFLFYVLLIVTFVVVWLVASLLLSLVFGLMGAETARFGFILSTAAAVTIFWCVYLAVLTSTHQQLGGKVQRVEGRWIEE